MLNALEKEKLAALKAAMGFKTEGLDLVSFCDAADVVNRKIRAAINKAEAAGADDLQAAAIRNLAAELWEDDEHTVDPECLVSVCEEGDGAWVQIWQFIDGDTLLEQGIDVRQHQDGCPAKDGFGCRCDEDDGCPKSDPECLGNNGDCHDACETPK